MATGGNNTLATWCRGQHVQPQQSGAPGVQTGSCFAVAIRVSPVSDVRASRGTVFAPTLCQYIHDLIDGKSFFDPYGADAMWMRVLFAIGAIQIYFREEKPSEAVSLINDLRGVLRDLDEFALDDARIRSFFEESIRYLETDAAADTLDRTAGEDEELSGSVQRIPTMVSKETLRYYKWLARTLEEPGRHRGVGKLDGVFHRVPGGRAIAEPASRAHKNSCL